MTHIRGYKLRHSYDARPKGKIISLPLAGAKFLTGWALVRATLVDFRATLVDNITAPNPICIKMKELGLIV